MDFTDEELDMIQFAMEYLHDADLSDMTKDEVKVIQGILDKFDVIYTSQLDDEEQQYSFESVAKRCTHPRWSGDVK